MLLDLFKGICHFFTMVNHHLGEYVWLFPSIKQANMGNPLRKLQYNFQPNSQSESASSWLFEKTPFQSADFRSFQSAISWDRLNHPVWIRKTKVVCICVHSGERAEEITVSCLSFRHISTCSLLWEIWSPFSVSFVSSGRSHAMLCMQLVGVGFAKL